jgi:hypothetical protein
MNHRIRWMGAVLAILSQAAWANSLLSERSPSAGFAGGTALPERVLHFPLEQAVGQILLIDESYVVPEISREFHPGYVFAPSQYLGPARGDVRIPAGKCVCLHLGSKGVTRQQCLNVLASLGPNDAQDLDFLMPIQADDEFMPYIAKLTGMTHFCPVSSRFTPKSWALLASLPRLEHICTPYGLTDADVEEIAKLQTVNEMEIVDTKLTDAGLVSLAKLRNLVVLHLEGTPKMTDEGLKALATLPQLRHLRLTGPFTDKGLSYLAALPSLKALWLETPRATDEGLRQIAQCKSLERLCVPWADTITDSTVACFKSMPKLVALGVGDAKSVDAGVVALAKLSDLEVLALKGSPGLTNNALSPLATMPKLRALEIYNSRITDQGLTNLYGCKRLDSVQIKSSIPVGQQAIARLKAELPNLRTVDISLPEQPMMPRSAQPAAAAMMR